MHLPNQVKPVSRAVTSEFFGPLEPGAVRASDWLDDLLKGVQVGTSIVEQIGKVALPLIGML
jgi:hypothetical protein